VVVDGVNGTVLPLATRPQWVPNFQVYEIAKDSARRSIQAAMGISPLPTAAQRDSEKSGIALERIDTQESIGSFHLSDNFDRALQNCGWQINELISEIYDTQREVPIEKADGTHDTIHVIGATSHPIDDEGNYDKSTIPTDEQGQPEEHLHTDKGDFDVTISTGPSFQSQREAQDEFVDNLLKQLPNLPVPPQIATKILAKAIRMRATLGIVAQDIAELLDPPDQNNLPPGAQAIVANLQGQLQAAQQQLQQYQLAHAAKLVDQQTKIQVEDMKGQHMLDAKTIDYITQIVKAELAKGSQQEAAQAAADADKELAMLGFQQDRAKQAVDNQHDATMQHSTQAHEVAHGAVEHARNMQVAEKQAQVQREAQAADQAHDAIQTAAGQAHEQTMAQQAQENQPEPGQ
jgi:Phage P22-like portal protein